MFSGPESILTWIKVTFNENVRGNKQTNNSLRPKVAYTTQECVMPWVEGGGVQVELAGY